MNNPDFEGVGYGPYDLIMHICFIIEWPLSIQHNHSEATSNYFMGTICEKINWECKTGVNNCIILVFYDNTIKLYLNQINIFSAVASAF